MTKQLCTALLLIVAVLNGACGSDEGLALCEAIRVEDLEEVEALIAQGADVNENLRFQGSFTKPIRLALMKLTMPSDKREAIAIALLEAGGNPNLAWGVGGGTSEGSSGPTMYALAIVARGGSAKVVEALIRAGARVEGQAQGGDALVAAAGANQVEVLRVLTAAGANVNYKNDSGDTALGAAVEAGAREAIAFLEERGAREW